MAIATTLPAQQFTVDQYHQMIDIGVLGEGDAVELIDGLVILKGQTHENGEPILYRFSEEQCLRMVADGIVTEEEAFTLAEFGVESEMPRNPAHDSAIERTDLAIRALLPAGLRVRVQSAIRLAGGEPEPDLAIVIGPVGSNDDHHPIVDEIAMVIEVSDSTLAYDRGIKLRAYAGAAIPAYWIVNLVDRQVEVYGNPKASRTGAPRFAKRSDYLPGQQVPVVLAGSAIGSIAVDAILPPG